MNKKLLTLFGLKYNPFGLDLPADGFLVTPRLENFFWRVVNSLVRDGGVALVLGEAGSGKSVALRLLIEALQAQEDVVVGVLSRPQSGVADFFREMGEIFGAEIKPHNRWAGFKVLRQIWQDHIDTRAIRPVLIIDEAQQTPTEVLSELRVLSSARLDSRVILSVVLAGDLRLLERFRQPELIPLASRIRFRLPLEPASSDELLAHLEHLLAAAGNSQLMTPELKRALVDHSRGNLRVLVNMANELLAAAARKGAAQLDEKLFLELYDMTKVARPAQRAPGRRKS